MEIGNPRSMNLYKRSLQYSKHVLDWTVNIRNEIEEEDFLQVRKMAMEIPKSIASALVDIHIKNKFKKLNKAKDTFFRLTDRLRNLEMESSEKRMVVLSMDLLKLFNGYFGYLGKRNRNQDREG